MNGKLKKLLSDTGLFAISSFGSKILIFLLTPLYTSVLLTREYGIADLISTTVSFVYPVLTLAIADAVLRFSLEKETDKKTILNTSLFFCVISSLALFLLFPLYSFIDQSLQDYWVFFLAYFFLFNLHNCLSNFLKGLGKTKLFAIQGIINTITIISCNILFLLVFKWGLVGYLLSILIGFSIPIVMMFVFGKIGSYFSITHMDKNLIREMLKYSLPMIPTLLAWAINTSIDKYMIIKMISLGESGIYSVAHKIPTIFTAIISIFIQAWQLSAISSHGDKNEGPFFTKVYNCMDFVSVIGCLLIICLSKFLSSFLFANEYYVAWRSVPMLVISAMFASHAGFLAAAFRAEKKTTSLLVSVIVGAVINIVLNLIFISNYGIIGASIATAVSFFVVWLIRIFLIQRIVKVKISIPLTAITYSLFFFTAFITIIDYKCSWVISVAVCVIVCLINVKNIKQIINLFSNALTKKQKTSIDE